MPRKERNERPFRSQSMPDWNFAWSAGGSTRSGEIHQMLTAVIAVVGDRDQGGPTGGGREPAAGRRVNFDRVVEWNLERVGNGHRIHITGGQGSVPRDEHSLPFVYRNCRQIIGDPSRHSVRHPHGRSVRVVGGRCYTCVGGSRGKYRNVVADDRHRGNRCSGLGAETKQENEKQQTVIEQWRGRENCSDNAVS